MDQKEQDLYAVLGVDRKATQAEIASAFKRRARELHPDVNKAPHAEEDFKRLVAAYEVLKDEEKRRRYDQFGTARKRPPPREPRPPRGRSVPNFEDLGIPMDDLNNPFDFVLRRAQRKAKKDREVELTITLEQAYQGTTLNVTLDAPGTKEQQRFKIRIPPGAKEGDRLKLKDSNIVVVLKVEPHPRFELEGRDISTTLNIAPWEAALGAEVELETPGGMVKVRVPPGTSSGQKLRLRGQGLPTKPGKEGEPGDLYVKTKIVLPRVTSERERELWEQLQKLSDFSPRS